MNGGWTILGAALALSIAYVPLTWLCIRTASRHGRDEPTIRGLAAGLAVLGALLALGNVVFVFVGTIVGLDTDTYTGRQALYLELALTGSFVLLAIFTTVAIRLIR